MRGSFGVLLMRISQTALVFVLSVALARTLGVEKFGIYALCISIVQLLTIPAMAGGQQMLIRETAAYKAKQLLPFLRGVTRRVLQISTFLSIILTFSAAGVGYFTIDDRQTLIPYLVSLTLIPLLACLRLQVARLIGLRHVLSGQAIESFQPILLLLLIWPMYALLHQGLAPELVILARIFVAAFLLVAAFSILRKVELGQTRQVHPKYETKKWLASMIPFAFAGSMQVLNREISVVGLGLLQDAESVGLFRVAQRGAELVSFGLIAVNMAIAPIISELFTKGELQRLQRLIHRSALAVLTFAVIVTIGLVWKGSMLISAVFGQEFAPAYVPLIILCLGHLINAGMGSVGLILNMTGLERYNAQGVAISAFLSIILNMTLIPIWGFFGAAIATSMSLIVWNVLLFIFLYKETGLVSTACLSFRKTE